MPPLDSLTGMAALRRRGCRRLSRRRCRRQKIPMTWSFIGYRGVVFGKHGHIMHEEMTNMYRTGEIDDSTPIMAENDIEFHKIGEWKRVLGGQIPFNLALKSFDHAVLTANACVDIIESRFLPNMPKVRPLPPFLPISIRSEVKNYTLEDFDAHRLPPDWLDFFTEHEYENFSSASLFDPFLFPVRRRSYRTYSAHFQGFLPSLYEETDAEIAESLGDFDDLNRTLPIEIEDRFRSWSVSSVEDALLFSPTIFHPGRIFETGVTRRGTGRISRGTDPMHPMMNREDKATNTYPSIAKDDAIQQLSDVLGGLSLRFQ